MARLPFTLQQEEAKYHRGLVTCTESYGSFLAESKVNYCYLACNFKMYFNWVLLTTVVLLLIQANWKKSKGKLPMPPYNTWNTHTHTHTHTHHLPYHRTQGRNSINVWKLIWAYYHKKINHCKTCEPLFTVSLSDLEMPSLKIFKQREKIVWFKWTTAWRQGTDWL